MAETKRKRSDKKQLGQFMTPFFLAKSLTDSLEFTAHTTVLEPSFGEGSFLIALVEKLLTYGSGTRTQKLQRIFTQQIYGVELDNGLYQKAIDELEARYGPLPTGHHLANNDFFLEPYATAVFDVVIGNPPFGGTFSADIEDRLDKTYGKWGEYKVKKETYSFFISRSLDLLKPNGTLRFISSDTFLTISTMKGLRRRLMDQCTNEVQSLPTFSAETSYPMVVLTAIKNGGAKAIKLDSSYTKISDITLTDNLSWSLPPDIIKYFRGPKLASYLVCTSGMTIGKNELFVRTLHEDGSFYEPYNFSFYQKPIRLAEEREKARLGKLPSGRQATIRQQEALGTTYRALRINPKKQAQRLRYPHKHYAPYNKANNAIVYSAPKNIVYWKDDGDAVLTYKKTGNWYLRGVGGQKYFMREGLTWQLISSQINMKYLPPGYILDSGAPCAFLKPGVPASELWFILGWTLSGLATSILKTTINHTKNIQGKDIERLPYPWWVDDSTKANVIRGMKQLVERAQAGETITRDDPFINRLNELFVMTEAADRLLAGESPDPAKVLLADTQQSLAF